jgi:hypothetical protein
MMMMEEEEEEEDLRARRAVRGERPPLKRGKR